jgi:hypothetical protein
VRWLVLFAFAAMQALTCGHFHSRSHRLGCSIVGRRPWSDLARVIGVGAVAVLAMVPVLYGYWRIQNMYGMRRWPNEIAGFSADVASLLKAAPALRIWGWLNVYDRPESELFPGLTILVLIVAGAVMGWKAVAASRTRLRVVPVLVVAAIVFLLVAPTPILFGPWKLEIGGVQLLSVGTPHKPLSVAFVLLIAAAALNPTARALFVRRSPFAFFVLAAFAMWLLALGPAPTLMNQPILYKAPYTWLMSVPGVEGVACRRGSGCSPCSACRRRPRWRSSASGFAGRACSGRSRSSRASGSSPTDGRRRSSCRNRPIDARTARRPPPGSICRSPRDTISGRCTGASSTSGRSSTATAGTSRRTTGCCGSS